MGLAAKKPVTYRDCLRQYASSFTQSLSYVLPFGIRLALEAHPIKTNAAMITNKRFMERIMNLIPLIAREEKFLCEVSK